MNYLIFSLYALFSLASAAYTVQAGSTYVFNYEAELESKSGKECTGFAKMVFDFNGKETFYGKEIRTNKLTLHYFEWTAPEGVTTLTITPSYKFKPEGSDVFTFSSDNCKVIYKNQSIKLKEIGNLGNLNEEECKMLQQNRHVVGYEAELEGRVRACMRACGITSVFGVGVSVLAMPYLAPLLAGVGPTALICAKTCRNTACTRGLVGAECVKLTRGCNPNGLRCCNDYTCKKLPNGRGDYKCRK